MSDSQRVTSFYFSIAWRNQRRYEDYMREIDAISASEKDDWMKEMETSDARFQSLKCAVESIVFSAMCLESFIYGYSVKCLGQSYTKAHIDRIGIESKYIIVPKLIVGKELDRSGQAYQMLKQLIKDRNSIVHFKSTADFLSEKSFLPTAMDNGINAIYQLMKELEAIHPEEFHLFRAATEMEACFA
jgi:hypothetical protein